VGQESVPALLESTARSLVQELGVSACAISRVVGDLLVDIVGYSPDRDRLFLGYGFLVSEFPVTHDVLERRVPRSLTVHDAGVDEGEARILRDLGFQSLLMLPLVRGETSWALVEIYDATKRKFGPRDLATAEAIVRDAGVELERLTAR
jgi:GAF domain-containing protein